MTTYEKLKTMLIDHGMFDSDAELVMEIAKPQIDTIVPSYRITWNSASDEYQDAMYGVWWIWLKKIALEWIEQNAPRAWFKELFK